MAIKNTFFTLLLLVSVGLLCACYDNTPCSGATCFKSVSWLGYADATEVQKQYEIAIKQNPNFTVNTTDKALTTPLMYMARNNQHANAVALLIKYGANVNQQNKDGWTALLYAADNNRVIDVIKVLLANGADVNITNNYGEDAILRATKNAGYKQSDADGLTAKSLHIIDLLKSYKNKTIQQ